MIQGNLWTSVLALVLSGVPAVAFAQDPVRSSLDIQSRAESAGLICNFMRLLTGQDKDMEETRNKLESIKISINEKDISLGQIIKKIREVGDLNIHINPAIAADFALEGGKKINLVVENVTLKTALKLALQDGNYTIIYKQSVLYITTKDEVKQNMVSRVYDVRDLLLKIQDFAGPRVELTPQTGKGGGGGGGLVGNVFSLDSSAGEKLNIIDAEFLQRMIRQNTGESEEKSWGNGANLELKNGMLWVLNTKTMQKEVHRFIQILRHIKR